MNKLMIGTIDWYDAHKGLGEIVDSNGVKYFVKSSYWRKNDGIPRAGQKVEFLAVMENEHWQAKNANRILESK